MESVSFPFLFLFPFTPHFLEFHVFEYTISENILRLSFLRWGSYITVNRCSNQSRFTTTAINITQLHLTLWIIMMTAIVVHFTDGNRYTSIDCCCRCSIDASKLRTQDYFILSSMDDNSCEILLTVTTRIIRTIIVYHKYYYFYIF